MKPRPSSSRKVCYPVRFTTGIEVAPTTSVTFLAPVTGTITSYSVVTEVDTDAAVTFTVSIDGQVIEPSAGIVVPDGGELVGRQVLATGFLGSGAPARVVQDVSLVRVTSTGGEVASSASVNVYFESAQ